MRIQQELAGAEKCRRELEAHLDRLYRALSDQRQVEDLARRLSWGLDTLDFAERRGLLRLPMNQVVYDDGQVTIRTILPLEQLHPIPLP